MRRLNTTQLMLLNIFLMLCTIVLIGVIKYNVVPSVQRANNIPTDEERRQSKELIAQLREDLNDIASVGLRADVLSSEDPYGPICAKKMNGYVKFVEYVAKDYNDTTMRVYPSMLKFCKLPTSVMIISRARGFGVKFIY
jgi:hypothetical protein